MNILLLGPETRNKAIKEFLLSQGNHVVSTTEEITLDYLREREIGFVISSGYAPIIREPIITEYAHRIINLHNTFLPYGRGIYGNMWSFLEGTPKGVSIHFIDAGIDTGDLIAQKEVSFSPGDTLKSSHDKLMAELERLFFDKWSDIAAKRGEPVRQGRFTIPARYHGRIESERIMDLLPERWGTPVKQVEEMGAELSLSGCFWQEYDAEIRGLASSH